MRIQIKVRSNYNDNLETIVFAKIEKSNFGNKYLTISNRQVKDAEKRVNLSSKDYLRFATPEGDFNSYGFWQNCEEGYISLNL